ncbi:2-amino-4-hydroxy-6-hydroxymethyldihydropteridine diphosphokinase [Sphingomonas sp. HDW15A]|uniref:2-amino-4-hydroxy-6- hydroxymethyldihydropteridine diphosphokinase n=1 Tax=Sphingomonas sp. HDW15A TaxID=2714942 RepID=UPI00140A2304|nr:2-amino-4-hydroxy-6-hydroxymethyldihydropteridine diphosphokinase [Sphingomonas sp. HDW15A]QIK96218.1 2-amino-4-hydroxy-6-hydroxymethyldihydropteridine diphosphokinase [Sphingomonas sp. HDW15A]
MAEATHLYAIGIGSNRTHGRHGRPPQVVESAIAMLDAFFELFDASPILINPAAGGAGRDFANAVALVQSQMAPDAMLAALKAMEREYGRRPGRRWGPRVLDLDILAWSGGRFSSRGLTVPHPRLAERAFAIGPFAAIAPGWRLRGGITTRHLAARLARRGRRG